MIKTYKLGTTIADELNALVRIARKFSNQRQLLMEMVRQEISERHAGQALGKTWLLIHPVVMIGVYVFVFGIVFKARTGESLPTDCTYTTYLLAGLIPWLTFQELMGKASTTIIRNASLVKQIIFPIEILPVQAVLSSFISQVICFILFFIYLLCTGADFCLTYLLLPVLWFFQIVAMTGTCYIFSTAGVFFRDLREITQVVTFIGMYTMPLFYLPQWLPAAAKPVIYLNPFSYMLWCYRDLICDGAFTHPLSWVVFCGGSVIVFFAGLSLFERSKHMFGDVL